MSDQERLNRAEGPVGEALDLLRRALDVEYRFILYYPKVEKLMPDEDTAQKVRLLGQDSVRHADIVSQAITNLGGAATIPTLDPLPDPLNLQGLFRTQLEYEKLALWLYNQAAGLVPPELASYFGTIAEQEKWHIRVTEGILQRLG